jgi:hypothetical protein
MRRLVWTILAIGCGGGGSPAVSGLTTAEATSAAHPTTPVQTPVHAIDTHEPATVSPWSLPVDDDTVHWGNLLTGEEEGDLAERRGAAEGDRVVEGDRQPGFPVRVSVTRCEALGRSTLTPRRVLVKITSAYVAGIKRCYREYLKKDTSAQGMATLSLEINETGRTVMGTAKGFAAELDECIGSYMSYWRFPIPKDNYGEPIHANFAIELALTRD